MVDNFVKIDEWNDKQMAAMAKKVIATISSCLGVKLTNRSSTESKILYSGTEFNCLCHDCKKKILDSAIRRL